MLATLSRRRQYGGVSRTSPRLWLGAAAVLLIVAVVLIRAGNNGTHESESIGDADRDGWQTIEYRGVRVDVPDDWERKDTDGCPYVIERWGPEDSTTCGEDFGVGVSLLPSENFDAIVEPGEVRRDPGGGIHWSGYVLVAPLALAADGSREVVEAVLSSARGAELR